MIKLLPAILFFIYCVFSFFREIRLEHERYLEQDRLGDEHIMREIEKFLKQKEAEKLLQSIDQSHKPL